MTSITPELLAQADAPNFPEEYGALKRAIVPPEDETALVKSWGELIEALDASTKEIVAKGSDIIPQVEFSELKTISPEKIAEIRRVGSVVIRNVVDDELALQWKADLREYVKANPQVRGVPEDNKQFFELYWSKSQVAGRSHKNVIAAQAFLNGIWTAPKSPDTLVSLSTPVVYADRLRMRHANGEKWDRHRPHIDGASIERWSDDHLRSCYEPILKGKWTEHDPYYIDGRVTANSNHHKRPGQSSVFRAWQGWLAMSNTGPHEGTLQVFPSVQLSNAYVVLRPFFRLKDVSSDPRVASNWEFDATTAHFPALQPNRSMRLTESTHPSLRLDQTMISMPRVQPGDMVFWHCDVIHAVEEEHTGPDDSSVMYIPAVPLTLQNASYVARQRDAFLAGLVPPDFPVADGEKDFKGRAVEADVTGVEGRRAMGFESFPIAEGLTKGETELLKEASRLVAV